VLAQGKQGCERRAGADAGGPSPIDAWEDRGIGPADIEGEPHMRRIAAAGAMLLALTMAAPAAGNETERWTDLHEISGLFACGVVEETTATIDGTAYFDGDGEWIKDVLRFSYDASFTELASGTTISYRTRQVIIADPATISQMGQGIFVRAAGGAVLLDLGRLVFDPDDGSTLFKSAQTIEMDDPSAWQRYEVAICSLF
jgi:hypothetical protein